METIDIGLCCSECLLAIDGVNDDMTPNQSERTTNGIRRIVEWNGLSSLHTGDSEGFCNSTCDVCGNPAGERFALFGLASKG
jgi:hypothetical protein